MKIHPEDKQISNPPRRQERTSQGQNPDLAIVMIQIVNKKPTL